MVQRQEQRDHSGEPGSRRSSSGILPLWLVHFRWHLSRSVSAVTVLIRDESDEEMRERKDEMISMVWYLAQAVSRFDLIWRSLCLNFFQTDLGMQKNFRKEFLTPTVS